MQACLKGKPLNSVVDLQDIRLRALARDIPDPVCIRPGLKTGMVPGTMHLSKGSASKDPPSIG